MTHRTWIEPQSLICLLSCLLLAGPAAVAGTLYKWVDEDGNTHYSDQPPPEEVEEDSVEHMVVDDGYGIKQVSRMRVLPAHANSPVLVLKSMDFRLSSAEFRKVTIGRLFYGNGCKKVVDLTWEDGFFEYEPGDIGAQIGAQFEDAGYRFETIAPGYGHLSLTGTIVSLRIDACARGYSSYSNQSAANMSGSVYLKVSWKLLNGADEVLFSHSSEGSYKGRANNKKIREAYLKALEQATTNLLSVSGFRDSVNSVGNLSRNYSSTSTVRWTGVTVSFGDGSTQFADLAKQLLAASVTIRQRDGHGSGVYIEQNTVLTNAHVVGTQSEVTVITDEGEFRGRVISRDVRRDVALVQTSSRVTPVKISRSSPYPGDPLYVIGTPLDESLSHTVTKGILSAKRTTDGQSFYQTDASINPGNSGGPVLDNSGELIGITVSGIFTRDGAGVNVNYVIPIQSALKTLGIESG